MSARLEAVFYRAPDGSEPVESFIAGLPVADQATLDNQIARLQLLSVKRPHLPDPHATQIDGELYVLRCRCGASRYRIVYRRSLTLHVLLHAYREQPGVSHHAELALARARWEDLRSRMNASRRAPSPGRASSGGASRRAG